MDSERSGLRLESRRRRRERGYLKLMGAPAGKAMGCKEAPQRMWEEGA